MAELRELLTHLGLFGVQSLLRSGNLVFQSRKRATAHLERLLEVGAEERLAFKTEVFVRSAREWESIVALNPFIHEAEHAPSSLVLMLFKEPPILRDVLALQARITGPEVVRARANHAYIVYPNGFGRTRLTTALVERSLHTRGTARSWSTVLKLHTLVTA